MAATAQEQLDAIDDAILAIVTGRVAQVSRGTAGGGSQSLSRLSLSELRQLRSEVAARAAAASAGPVCRPIWGAR